MTDTFSTHTRSLTSPPEHGAGLVPDDAADLAHVTRAVFVGGTGDLAVTLLGGDTVTLRGVPGGTLVPLRVSRLLASGTTATDIVGLW
jgi:hypothetical protein